MWPRCNRLIVLGLLAVTIALFAFEIYSVDVITLRMLLILAGIKVLLPAAAFAGFGQAIIIFCEE